MRRVIWMVVLLVPVGCTPRAKQYTNSDIPRSYLKALASEEGISEEEARQKVIESRGKMGAVTMADVQAGRLSNKHGAKEPTGSRTVRLTAR